MLTTPIWCLAFATHPSVFLAPQEVLRFVFIPAGRVHDAPWTEEDGHCAPRLLHLPFAVHKVLSLVPCTAAVHGAADHNRWGVAETLLPAKTQGRNMDRSFSVAGYVASPVSLTGRTCQGLGAYRGGSPSLSKGTVGGFALRGEFTDPG